MKKSLFIIPFTLLLACGSYAENKKTTDNDSTTKVVTTPKVIDVSNNKLNQTARLIAGIANPKDSSFSQITSTAQWQKYAQESELKWKEYHAKNKTMYSWFEKEILPSTATLEQIYYPFSGPDFLYGNLIFPNAKDIYMFGLEEIGSVPDFSKINAKDIDMYLTFYKKSIGEVLQYSFYRTLGMKEYLHNANIDGVTQVLMLFLAQTGKQISEVNMLTLNEDGSIRKVGDDEKFRKLTNRGVEIKYYNGKDDVERRLVFFTGNIADGALSQNTAYKKYYQSLRPEGAFSKSATYLMHKSYFSEVRNVILNNCKVVVSDDSGIAFRLYDPKIWDVKLFGTYSRPIDLFKDFFEADLLEAYKASNSQPLGFRIGYSSPSNIRLVLKK